MMRSGCRSSCASACLFLLYHNHRMVNEQLAFRSSTKGGPLVYVVMILGRAFRQIIEETLYITPQHCCC